MQQIICECGNKVEMSDERIGFEHRCPRCGRRIFANESDAKADFDLSMDDARPKPIHSEENLQPEQPLRHTYVPVTRHSESDPDATVIHTNAPSTPPNHPGGHCDSAWGTAQAFSVDDNDFDVNYPPSAGDSEPSTPSSGSGAKYDLTQRVMRAIAKPIAPIIPYSGTGKYGIHRILRVHQRGGMGRILVGYDQYLKREVAVKELHPDVAEDESIVRRFIGEAEITAQLEHPGVVPIHRLGQGGDGLPYYTMKMIKGETFQEAIKAYHRKPSKLELLNLIRRLVSISKTIAFAHSKGVIHRDLKPANVMLGEHGETLVMDWGLAKPYNQGVEDTYISVIHQTKQLRPELTMVGAIVGTPAFMSPEQANAEDNMVGPLSDVFSLGTVLYYLLAGQTAFSGRSTQEVLSKVRACNPTPPSHVKPNVPHALETICLKAMAKLPENRYQGATEFADDLCRWLDDEPVVAEKVSFFSKIRRWILHYRTPLAGIVWVLILSLLLTWMGVWIVERNRHDTFHTLAGEEMSNEFKKNVPVREGAGIENVWTMRRNTGELSLTCQVSTMESEKRRTLSIYALTGSPWDLSERDFLTFSLLEIQSTDKASLQNLSLQLHYGDSYYEYKPSKELWEKRNGSNWNYFEIPLRKKHDDWSRGTVGEPTLTNVERIEIHFDVDSDMILIVDDLKFRGE